MALNCTYCEFETDVQTNFKKHLSSQKHVDTICKLPANTELPCLKCNAYSTTVKDTFRRHMETCKGPKQTKPSCSKCKREFKSRSGAYKHESKCLVGQQVVTVPELETIVNTMVAEMRELTSHMHTTVNNANTIVNGNVNTVTLQVFLNEHCKNAMNIMDFARNIQLNYQNLECIGSKGYVQGLTQVISNALQAMDVTERPLHCTDARRHVLHVKHDGTWQQEDEGYPIAMRAVKLIRARHTQLLKSWLEEHPLAKELGSVLEGQYYRILQQVLGGRRCDDITYDLRTQKIVKRVCPSVKLTKDMMTIKTH
jgi:hypothetical protein